MMLSRSKQQTGSFVPDVSRVRRGWILPALLSIAGPVFGSPEYLISEDTAPTDVEESPVAMEQAFQPTEERNYLSLVETFRKGNALLRLRNYYSDRIREELDDSRAWAQGGWLGYETAWWRDHLRVGAKVFTSQKLSGPDDKDGTLLLKPGQESFTVLGEAYLEAQPIKDVSVKLYRQSMDLLEFAIDSC